VHHEKENTEPDQMGLGVDAVLYAAGIGDGIDDCRESRQEVPYGLEQQF